MGVILGFSDHCKRPHENLFFKERTQKLNLTLSGSVILFSRHVNSQLLFIWCYFREIKANNGCFGAQ